MKKSLNCEEDGCCVDGVVHATLEEEELMLCLVGGVVETYSSNNLNNSVLTSSNLAELGPYNFL